MGKSNSPGDDFQYQCCFCGEMILDEEPLQIAIVFPSDGTQGLWTHGECLKKKLHSSVPFMTPAELAADD